jgi:hypothetical protein
MTILILSQIIINFVASFAIIVLAVLFGIIAYETIKFIKSIKKLSNEIKKESNELHNKINNFLETVSNLSFFTKFFKKKRK